MSFEVQELPDLIRLVILLSLRREDSLTKYQLKERIEEYLENSTAIDMGDLEETLMEMIEEGLVKSIDGKFSLTSKAIKLSEKWKNILTRREPILEFVAGLTDGTICSLVVILSTFIAGLSTSLMLWAALLSLAAVSITNFSSFMLGSKTEDLADALSLKILMEYSVSDIPDREERRKSLRFVRHLFSVLEDERAKASVLAALTCSATTFLAGIVPIVLFLGLPKPYNLIASLLVIAATVSLLIRYRSEKSRIHWTATLIETLIILTIAVVASILLGKM